MSGRRVPGRVSSGDRETTQPWHDPTLLPARRSVEVAQDEAPPAAVPTATFSPGERRPDGATVSALQRLVAARTEPITVEVRGRAGADVPDQPGADALALAAQRATAVAEAVEAVAPPGSTVEPMAEAAWPDQGRTEGRRAEVRVRAAGTATDRLSRREPSKTADDVPTPAVPPPPAARTERPTPRDHDRDPERPATDRLHPTNPPQRSPLRDGEARRGIPQRRYRNGLDRDGNPVTEEGKSAEPARPPRPAVLGRAGSDPTGRLRTEYALDLRALTFAYGLRGAAPIPQEHLQLLAERATQWDDALRRAGAEPTDVRRLVHLGLALGIDRALVFTGLPDPERFLLDGRLLPAPPEATDHRPTISELLARLLGPDPQQGGRR